MHAAKRPFGGAGLGRGTNWTVAVAARAPDRERSPLQQQEPRALHHRLLRELTNVYCSSPVM